MDTLKNNKFLVFGLFIVVAVVFFFLNQWLKAQLEEPIPQSPQPVVVSAPAAPGLVSSAAVPSGMPVEEPAPLPAIPKQAPAPQPAPSKPVDQGHAEFLPM